MPPADTEPPAPVLAGLADEGSAFIRAIFRDFEPLPAAEAEVARVAAMSLDRAAAARALLTRDGLLIDGANQTKVAHPAIRVERQAMAQYLAALRQLGLPPLDAKGQR